MNGAIFVGSRASAIFLTRLDLNHLTQAMNDYRTSAASFQRKSQPGSEQRQYAIRSLLYDDLILPSAPHLAQQTTSTVLRLGCLIIETSSVGMSQSVII